MLLAFFYGVPASQVSGLTNTLNVKAERILDTMESEKQKALASIRSGKGRKSESELISEYEGIRKLFIDLHNKNIEAIKSGQFKDSHDITLEIHHLLWIRTRDTYLGAFAERASFNLSYGNGDNSPVFPDVSAYAELYSESSSESLNSNYSKQLEEFLGRVNLNEALDKNRLKRISDQIQKNKPPAVQKDKSFDQEFKF